MAEIATTVPGAAPSAASSLEHKMNKTPAWVSTVIVLAALIGGLYPQAALLYELNVTNR